MAKKNTIDVEEIRKQIASFHAKFPDYDKHAFFFDKKFIKSLLRGKDVSGIRLFPILNEEGECSLQAVGVDAKGDDILIKTKKVKVTENGLHLPDFIVGDSLDYNPPRPCPDMCGSGVMLSSKT